MFVSQLIAEAREIDKILNSLNGMVFVLHQVAQVKNRLPMEVTLNKTLISVLELRRLMIDLSEKRPDICIRFRLLGELWTVNFLKVVRVDEKGAVLLDEVQGLVSVSDLNFIMQMEIDKPFQGYQPYYHYEVTPVFDM